MKAAIVGLLASTAAFAQCSMCRTAAASNVALTRSLDSAVLILFLPAMCLFCGVMLTAYRGNRNRDE
jgi:hypothetical protein